MKLVFCFIVLWLYTTSFSQGRRVAKAPDPMKLMIYKMLQPRTKEPMIVNHKGQFILKRNQTSHRGKESKHVVIHAAHSKVNKDLSRKKNHKVGSRGKKIKKPFSDNFKKFQSGHKVQRTYLNLSDEKMKTRKDLKHMYLSAAKILNSNKSGPSLMSNKTRDKVGRANKRFNFINMWRFKLMDTKQISKIKIQDHYLRKNVSSPSNKKQPEAHDTIQFGGNHSDAVTPSVNGSNSNTIKNVLAVVPNISQVVTEIAYKLYQLPSLDSNMKTMIDDFIETAMRDLENGDLSDNIYEKASKLIDNINQFFQQNIKRPVLFPRLKKGKFQLFITRLKSGKTKAISPTLKVGNKSKILSDHPDKEDGESKGISDLFQGDSPSRKIQGNKPQRKNMPSNTDENVKHDYPVTNAVLVEESKKNRSKIFFLTLLTKAIFI